MALLSALFGVTALLLKVYEKVRIKMGYRHTILDAEVCEKWLDAALARFEELRVEAAESRLSKRTFLDSESGFADGSGYAEKGGSVTEGIELQTTAHSSADLDDHDLDGLPDAPSPTSFTDNHGNNDHDLGGLPDAPLNANNASMQTMLMDLKAKLERQEAKYECQEAKFESALQRQAVEFESALQRQAAADKSAFTAESTELKALVQPSDPLSKALPLDLPAEVSLLEPAQPEFLGNGHWKKLRNVSKVALKTARFERSDRLPSTAAPVLNHSEPASMPSDEEETVQNRTLRAPSMAAPTVGMSANRKTNDGWF
jgi:hypothetical protein